MHFIVLNNRNKPKNKSVTNVCFINNAPQHYRRDIFNLIDQKIKADFYFGDCYLDVKFFDASVLTGFKGYLRNRRLFFGFYWQGGVLPILMKRYSHVVMLGEYHCISTWLFALFSKLIGTNLIFWTHGFYGNEGLLRSFVKIKFYSLASGLFLYGEYSKKELIRRGFHPQSLTVIYNSVSYFEQLKLRNSFINSNIYKEYFDNHDKVIVFVGRLTKNKKLDLLIKASRYLQTLGFPINVIFVGSGPEESNLKMMLEATDKKRYWFFGECYDECKLAEIFSNADLCVSPGNVGLTAIHSLGFGTPVVTHNNLTNQMPECEAIIDGVSGSFFRENDYFDLSRVILRSLKIFENEITVRENCFTIIDEKYNPNNQLRIIRDALNANNEY